MSNKLEVVSGNGKKYATEIPYSASERRVGTWKDGNPIYRQVFSSSNKDTYYDIPITQPSYLISISGFVYRKDYGGLITPIPGRVDESSYKIVLKQIERATNYFRVHITWGSNWTDSMFDKIEIIIEYTKHTDD